MYPLLEIALTLGVLFTLVLTISACVCGCKNSNQKSELVGTAGVLKIHYDEEAPSPTPTTPASIKRASTQNSQRSLPEIPHPVGRHDSGDTASEIYATVNIDEGNKIKAVASSSRDHPYEHAYAKVQNENDLTLEGSSEREPDNEIQVEELEAGQFGPESVVISASVAISGHLPSSQELPYITPPSPRPHERGPQHFSGDSTDSTKGYTSISVREPLSNIRAALQANKAQVQTQYAAVSDDSDEMYAAIEEPVDSRCTAEISNEARTRLATDTYAQIAPVHAHTPTNTHVRRSLEREPTPGRTVGNDAMTRRSAPPEMGAINATHSRQASSSSCTNSGAHSSPKPEKRQANSPLPPTPASTRPAAERGRSPHASASTATTSHRQQRISSTGDLHFSHDKVRRSLNEKHQRNNSCVSSSDFYGCNYPVDKHRFSSGDLCRPLGAKELRVATEPTDALYNSIDGPTDRLADSPTRNLDDMYAKVIKKSKNKILPDDGHITRRNKDFSRRDGESNSSNYREDDPGYETIDRKKSTSHGYETIVHKDRKSSQSQDPGYETVKDIHRNAPNANFANNNLMKLSAGIDSGPDSLLSSDPGYEHIAKTDNSASDSDPNYEVLRNQPPTPPYATIAPNFKTQPTYSIVNKKPAKYNDWTANNNDPTLEPNYESMPNDPLYTTGSESDPNYESVRPKDPNYESVSAHDPNYESLQRKDPKYESVRSKDSKYDSVRSKDPNYESVKYFELSKKDPPYERLHNKVSESNEIERSDSTAGYEKINVANNREPKNSINSGGENGTVSDYFQV